VSGPVLDRLDLQIEVSALTSDELLRTSLGEPSAVVRDRVLAAQERQRRRGALNAMLSNAALRRHCAPDAAGTRLIADAVDRGGMSARGVHRASRVARTIADLAGEERVTAMRLPRRCNTAPTSPGDSRSHRDDNGIAASVNDGRPENQSRSDTRSTPQLCGQVASV
jgi:hypothetical protein